MTEQPAGKRGQFVQAQAHQWPQYKKFSAALGMRAIIGRTLAALAAAALIAYAWTGERMEAPADMHVVTFVQFPRVTIVGKRANASEAIRARKTPADPRQSVDPAPIEFDKTDD